MTIGLDSLALIQQQIGNIGPAPVPSGGTFVSGLSALVTDGTAKEVIAAPAAGNHLVITRVILVNITAGEVAMTQLLDATPTAKVVLKVGDPAVLDIASGFVDKCFNPGLVCASAKAFQAKSVAAVAATGDVYVYAEGYSIAD